MRRIESGLQNEKGWRKGARQAEGKDERRP